MLPLQGSLRHQAEPGGATASWLVPVQRPPFQWANLQQVPDDSNRYEIIDAGGRRQRQPLS